MGARVLVVDDALFMRKMLRAILEDAGYIVAGEAADGIEAVEKYAELRPDLVTMDIVMPRKSGIDALAEIRRSHGDARVVMCSAMGQESLVREALTAGAVDFILKPFNRERVVDVIGKAAEL